ncbi:MAG: hypothetical protein ACKVT2_04155 [Saprospiraceae bacterium]
MRNTLFFTAALLLLTLASCKEKKNSIYEGCCGTEPILDTTLVTALLNGPNGTLIDSTFTAYVYIPNIIIIDTTGISPDNRWLTLHDGNLVQKILIAVYSGENGEILFTRENFLPNTPSLGWGGLKPDGTYYQGVFNYKMIVEFIGGQTKTYDGKACAYLCGDDGFPSGNLPGCFFPTQHNGNGGHDPSLAFPSDCF